VELVVFRGEKNKELADAMTNVVEKENTKREFGSRRKKEEGRMNNSGEYSREATVFVLMVSTTRTRMEIEGKENKRSE